MFSLGSLNSVNSNIMSNIASKNNSNNLNKKHNSCNSLQDEYVSSAKVADLISGVYSKEAENTEQFEEEYEQYCCIKLYSTAANFCERVYFPPPNATYDVKKAWIETMKSLSSDEQLKVQKSILNAVQVAIGKPSHKITGKMYQDYLNKYASFSGIEGFYFKNFLDSTGGKYDPLMNRVLNEFKTNHESYSVK